MDGARAGVGAGERMIFRVLARAGCVFARRAGLYCVRGTLEMPIWHSMRVLSWCMAPVLCVSLHAQVFDCVRSIDAFVADGDVVVVGRITTSGNSFHDAYGTKLYPITLRVDETLRGEAARSLDVNLILEFANSDERIRGWREHGNRLLIAIEHSAQRADRPPGLAEAIDLDATSIAEWRADFVLLKTKHDVLEAAREEARRIPAGVARMDIVCIDKDKGFGQGTNLADTMTIGLVVPADDRMEARARSILNGSREPGFGSDSMYRSVEALGHIDSEENTRFLKQVLHGSDERLRWGAYYALQRLGVPVTAPQSASH